MISNLKTWAVIIAFALAFLWGFVAIAQQIGSAAAGLFGVSVLAATVEAVIAMLLPFVIVGLAIWREFQHPTSRHVDTPAESEERRFWRGMATIMVAWIVIGLVLVAPRLFCQSNDPAVCRQLAAHPIGLLLIAGAVAAYTAAAVVDGALRRAGRTATDPAVRRAIYLGVGSLTPPAAAAVWVLAH